MASVRTIPPEILSAIFHFTLYQPFPRLHAAQLLVRHRAHIHVLAELALVCRRWRNTVLNDGTLWANLPVQTSRSDCRESTTTVLERSKNAMLNVSVVCDDDTNSTHEDVFSEISKNFSRIKSLHFATTSPGMLRNLSASAPKLETLEIFTAEEPEELEFLFGGNLPALRSLVLAGFPSWPCGLFLNLKDLCLILPPSHPATRVSTLIEVMAGSPNIEQIRMSAFIFVVDDSPPSSMVRLPNLQKFTMRDCDSATILSHTIIPATADIKVVIDHHRMRTTMGISSRDYHILSLIPRDLSGTGLLAESTMFVLQQNRKVGFGIGFYRSRSSQPSLRILDHSKSVDLFARRSIEALESHPHHFRNVKDLSTPLSAGVVVPWPGLLRSFERLERLSVVAFHAPSVLSALMVVGQDNHPICPTLRRLDIHEKGGDVIALDEEDMDRFFAARAALGCAAANVNVRWSGGMKTWDCKAVDGQTEVTY